MKLPIPYFKRVTEVVIGDDVSVVLITPALSGSRRRYSVVRIDRGSGEATCIGRELPLGLARRAAGRPAKEDGKPLEKVDERQLCIPGSK